MKNIIRIVAILLILIVLTISSSAMNRECGISERVTLENTTEAPITYTFTRGSHDGFVVVQPGQTVTVDVVWCK